MKLTVVITRGEEFCMASIKEIPAVITQGKTVAEARENVIDALKLYLEDMQQEPRFENTVLEEDLNILA